MRCFHRASIFAVVAFSTAATSVRADSIKLDSGKVIEGSIVTETSAVVQLAVGGAVLTIPRAKITAINKGTEEATSAAATLEELVSLETKGLWPDLYEAATRLLSRETSNTVAIEKRKLAAEKIRESLGGKRVEELVRDRKFDEAITTLTEQIRRSGLASRGAGAVGRRALAEVYLSRARFRLRDSLDSHVPLSEARKARELDPSTPGLDSVEAMAQMNLHNFDQAIPLLERAARAEPANYGLRISLIKCYREKGDFSKILQIYETAPSEADANAARWPEVRTILAETYLKRATELADQGAKAQAAAAYEKYLDFSERTADDLRDAATFFERIGDYERAKSVRSERARPRGGESRVTTGTMPTSPLRR